MKVMFIYDFASDYTNKSKPISSTIRIPLSITWKYNKTFNPNLAGQRSLLLSFLPVCLILQKRLWNASRTSCTASLCHNSSAIKVWSGYESHLPAVPVTHLPKHFPPALWTFSEKEEIYNVTYLHFVIAVLQHFRGSRSSNMTVTTTNISYVQFKTIFASFVHDKVRWSVVAFFCCPAVWPTM